MDAAFTGAMYPAYTTAQLEASYSRYSIAGDDETCAKISKELDRRRRVKLGDVSAMTPGERLHHAKK